MSKPLTIFNRRIEIRVLVAEPAVGNDYRRVVSIEVRAGDRICVVDHQRLRITGVTSVKEEEC